MEKLPKIGLPLVILFSLFLLVAGRLFYNINAGEAGVIFKTFDGGVETDKPPLGEGFKLEASAWFQPNQDELGKLHQEKGVNYKNRILLPAIRSAARSVVGRYTPEQLYSSKRDAIQTEIYDETKKIVEDQYIQLNEILVRDVTLPPTIKEAIERKLKQEQESLEYEFRLESARKEADKVRIDAQGKADANRILNSSLTTNILRDKGIEATIKLSESNNSKVIVIGSGESGLPIILGGNN